MSRSLVWIWGLWDWGAAGFSVLAWSFVFAPYLTSQVGAGFPAGLSSYTWLGLGVGAAGLALVLVAPGIGPWIGAGRRRHRSLALLSVVLVLVMLAMATIRPVIGQFWTGLGLLAGGLLVYELATIPYNTMLRDLSDTRKIGHVSGIGMTMGYTGGILLLGLSYLFFIGGTGPDRGLLGIPARDGLPIRASLLFGGIWFLLFSLPLLLLAPRRDQAGAARKFFEAYRVIWRDLREIWQIDRRVVQYLLISAVFRDGIVGFATFGAVIAASVYGFGPSELLVFGVASNIAAAIGAAASSRATGSYTTRQIITTALAAILLLGSGLLVSVGGWAFWAFGLAISLFVGPVLSGARTMLLELTPPGKEGEMFGLHAITGRTVAFISPLLFGFCSLLFHTTRGGAAGIMVVLAVGLAALVTTDLGD